MTSLLDRAVQDALHRLSSTYSIDGREDKGANGWLFFATSLVTGTQVAIKFYWWGNQANLPDEPRTLSRFSSRYISPILHAELLAEGWVCFICPRFSGDVEHLIQNGTPSLHRAIDVALNVSEGVGILHTGGIVHRDLKPANILIAADGIAAIGDFGSVASISTETGDAPSSRHSIIYRPPESFATNRYSPLGDMYQIAILLYELLGGSLSKDPLDWLTCKDRERYENLDDQGKSQLVDQSIARIAQKGEVADFRSLPFYVPAALLRLLRRQAGNNPDARIARSGDFMNALVNIRRACLDWRPAAEGAHATAGEVSIRILIIRQGAFVEVDRGKGFRRDRTLEGGHALNCALRCSKKFV